MYHVSMFLILKGTLKLLYSPLHFFSEHLFLLLRLFTLTQFPEAHAKCYVSTRRKVVTGGILTTEMYHKLQLLWDERRRWSQTSCCPVLLYIIMNYYTVREILRRICEKQWVISSWPAPSTCEQKYLISQKYLFQNIIKLSDGADNAAISNSYKYGE